MINISEMTFQEIEETYPDLLSISRKLQDFLSLYDSSCPYAYELKMTVSEKLWLCDEENFSAFKALYESIYFSFLTGEIGPLIPMVFLKIPQKITLLIGSKTQIENTQKESSKEHSFW
jgi:hypothetical protein